MTAILHKLPKALSPGGEAFALHCRAEGLEVTPEWMFHPTRKWRFDFAFIGYRVAVEIEGWGRHQRMGGFKADCEKYNAAAILGWRVLRYTTDQVKRGNAINDVLEIFRGMKTGREPHD